MKQGKVYLYEERHSRTQIVGKFFVNGRHETANAVQRMWQEFDNLQLLRGYDLAGYPHQVIRPLGTNAWLNSILVEEYAQGIPLSEFITAAIYKEQHQQLFEKLTALAYFLATLHNRTANNSSVDFNQDCAYLDRLVRKLQSKQIIGNWMRTNYIGSVTVGEKSHACGRTIKCSFMVMLPRAIFCSAAVSASSRSTWSV